MTQLVSATLAFVLCSVALHAQDHRSAASLDLFPFYHGVASGDPTQDAVILWSRVTPDAGQASIDVEWRLATDTGMTNVVASGMIAALESEDWTVKVDVTDLQPGTFYFYDFKALDHYSLRGRTRTLPASADKIRVAVLSCSNYEHGYFNAYKYLAERNDIDVVVHLGDYIYEYEVGGYSADIDGRDHEPTNEIISLDDYRTRHSHYKLDPDLRAAHQQYPWITVWDDHESANDAWNGGAQNHDGSEGPWTDRLNASKQAYQEWMPIRWETSEPLYRSFTLGGLVELIMLDTRIEGRDQQVGETDAAIDDPNRTILGAQQKTWLSETMAAGSSVWTVLGQQVMMAPLELLDIPLNADQWDGYRADRNWMYEQMAAHASGSTVVLTGDIHTSWANELPIEGYDHDAQNGSAGIELVCTSVTSPGLDGIPSTLVQPFNPHVQFVELEEHGFMVAEFTPESVQADWIFVNTLESEGGGFAVGASWTSDLGTPFLAPAGGPLETFDHDVPFAPECPIGSGTSDVADDALVATSVWPNPFTEALHVQLSAAAPGPIDVVLRDATGRAVRQEKLNGIPAGLSYVALSFKGIPSGVYTLELVRSSARAVRTVVKE